MTISIVVIASAWGTSKGGENVFNTDWVRALALKASIRCFILQGYTQDIKAAEAAGVSLSVLDCNENDPEQMIIERIAALVGPDRPDWWIGHDVHTGALANGSRIRHELSGVVHHMDYLSYKSFQGDNNVQNCSDQQASVLKSTDLILAVGPRLAQSGRA